MQVGQCLLSFLDAKQGHSSTGRPKGLPSARSNVFGEEILSGTSGVCIRGQNKGSIFLSLSLFLSLCLSLSLSRSLSSLQGQAKAAVQLRERAPAVHGCLPSIRCCHEGLGFTRKAGKVVKGARSAAVGQKQGN